MFPPNTGPSTASSPPFGSAAAASTPSSDFGAASSAASTPAFGFGAASSATSTPAFGFGAASSAASTPAFGFGVASSAAASPSFGFGAASSATSAPSFGFGAASSAASAPAFGLGAASAPSLGFGAASSTPASTSSAFGTPNLFGSTSSTTAPAPSIFGAASTGTTSSLLSSSGSAAPSLSTFGSAPTTATSSQFPSSSLFGASTSTTIATSSPFSSSGLFGASTPSSTTTLFGSSSSSATSSAGGLFGSSSGTSNLFGTPFSGSAPTLLSFFLSSSATSSSASTPSFSTATAAQQTSFSFNTAPSTSAAATSSFSFGTGSSSLFSTATTSTTTPATATSATVLAAATSAPAFPSSSLNASSSAAAPMSSASTPAFSASTTAFPSFSIASSAAALLGTASIVPSFSLSAKMTPAAATSLATTAAFSVSTAAFPSFSAASSVAASLGSSTSIPSFSPSAKSLPAASSAQLQSTTVAPLLGIASLTSAASTPAATATTPLTASLFTTGSASGTTSTTNATVVPIPKLPSEITGKTVEEIIKEWNSELQERTGKFRKQANAIAEWDKRILQNRDILLKLEVDKALQSIEEEAERIYKGERNVLLHDEAVSTRDAMNEQSEVVETELEKMAEQIGTVIQTLNCNQGGERKAVDGTTPMDVVVRILNNQLSSLMGIDEKPTVSQTFETPLLLITSSDVGVSPIPFSEIPIGDPTLASLESVTSPKLIHVDETSIEVLVEVPTNEEQTMTSSLTTVVSPEASHILKADNFDSFLEEIKLFEASFQHSSDSSSSLAFPSDQLQVEILIQFYKLIEIPINELTNDQLVELLEVRDKLETFAPLAFSLEQRAMINVYFKELKFCFDDIKDHQTQLSHARSTIKDVSVTRSKMKDYIEIFKTLQFDLTTVCIKEEELKMQLEIIQQERMNLENKLLNISQATKSLMASISNGPSLLAIAHRDLTWHQTQLSHYFRRWKEFKVLFKDNHRQ